MYDVQKGTGISRTQIMLYERGEQFPSEQSLRKLAAFFQLPYEELRTEYYEDVYSDPVEREILLRWAQNKALQPNESRLIEHYRQLPPEQQTQLIEELKNRASREKDAP